MQHEPPLCRLLKTSNPTRHGSITAVLCAHPHRDSDWSLLWQQGLPRAKHCQRRDLPHYQSARRALHLYIQMHRKAHLWGPAAAYLNMNILTIGRSHGPFADKLQHANEAHVSLPPRGRMVALDAASLPSKRKRSRSRRWKCYAPTCRTQSCAARLRHGSRGSAYQSVPTARI